MVKPYSFKLNEEIEEEKQLMLLLDTWRENGGTIKGFLLNQIPKIKHDTFLTREEWVHEKAVLYSCYSLIDDLIGDVEKVKADMYSLSQSVLPLDQ